MPPRLSSQFSKASYFTTILSLRMASRGLLLSALATLLVVLQFNLVLGISNGIYTISIPGFQLATQSSDSDARAILLPEQSGTRYTQRWKVEEMPDGLVYISNPESGMYLSYSYPGVFSPILLGEERKGWQLRQGQEDQESNSYYIVVPGGPVDGSELAVDMSPVRIHPPLAALGPYQQERGRDQRVQPWSFESQE